MQFDISQPQFVVKSLTLALGALVIFIVGHLIVDCVRYLAFRFNSQRAFIPRSWLFVAITAFWALFIPDRSHAIGIASSVDASELKASTKHDQIGRINSLMTCSVVIGGLLFEVGKIRARQMCKLEAHSRLSHPAANAVIIEQSLRAVENSDSETSLKQSSVLQAANSDSPVFVPCGIRDGQLVCVDLGRNSVVSILSNNKTEQLAVFNALLVSALFASTNRMQIVIYLQDAQQSAEFADILIATSFSEVIRLTKSTNLPCVVFSHVVLESTEIVQLLENNSAVVCQQKLANATTVLRADEGGWSFGLDGLSFNPYGLSRSQFESVGVLLRDVARCASTIEEDSANSAIAFQNVKDYKVLVRTLGPVDVQLADGTIVKFEKSKTKELLAWLTHHRARPTRSAARTALWEFTVADATFTNVVSDIRRTLNQTELLSPLEEWVPRTFTDLLPFHNSIVSDGELLQACIAKAKSLRPDLAVAELHRGLALVRDLPFAGTGYLWPDAEGITSQLVMTVITAAVMAAEIDLQRGHIDGVFWATAQGLKVLGAHEELFALRMRGHAARGDLAGARFEFESYLRAINSDSFSPTEPSQKLVKLLESLTCGNSVALAR